VHDLTLAGAFADRVALMASGRIVACGSPADVLQPEPIAATYGMRVRVMPHPETGRPIVVPEQHDVAVAATQAAAS
jgi:iron complex transport system ATP-binding protein